jgi:hypothetical protein
MKDFMGAMVDGRKLETALINQSTPKKQAFSIIMTPSKASSHHLKKMIPGPFNA